MGKKKLTKNQRLILRDMAGYLRYRIAANEGFWETIGVLRRDIETIDLETNPKFAKILREWNVTLKTFNFGEGWED